MNYFNKSQTNRNDRVIFTLVREHDVRGKCANVAPGTEVAQVEQSGVHSTVRRSSEITAIITGTSARKVERIRTILDRGNVELWSLIENGNLSINSAYNKVIEKNLLDTQLSVADVFFKCLKMAIPEDYYVRVMSEGELFLIKKFAEIFHAEGYVDLSDLKKIESIITRKLN